MCLSIPFSPFSLFFSSFSLPHIYCLIKSVHLTLSYGLVYKLIQAETSLSNNWFLAVGTKHKGLVLPGPADHGETEGYCGMAAE